MTSHDLIYTTCRTVLGLLRDKPDARIIVVHKAEIEAEDFLREIATLLENRVDKGAPNSRSRLWLTSSKSLFDPTIASFGYQLKGYIGSRCDYLVLVQHDTFEHWDQVFPNWSSRVVNGGKTVFVR